MSIRPSRAAAVAALASATLLAPARAQTSPIGSPAVRAKDAPPPTPRPKTSAPALAHGHPRAGHAHTELGHSHVEGLVHLPPTFGVNLLDGWLDPWPHTHHSRPGTPFVHTFASEPAFLGRELFLDAAFRDGPEEREIEVEAELEYAVTRRIGVVVEAPYAFLNPEEGDAENGLGDLAVAPRFLLLEEDRFLLSANVEFSFPTGNDEKELGSGQPAINPSLSAWVDLGARFTLQANAGVEHGFETDFDALTWGGALAYSFTLWDRPEMLGMDEAVRSHFPAGLTSLIAEVRGEHPLDGEDKGSGTAEVIFGASYSVTPHLELRGGLVLPAWKPRELERGVILGVIYHF